LHPHLAAAAGDHGMSATAAALLNGSCLALFALSAAGGG
jgi:hypothetical protein